MVEKRLETVAKPSRSDEVIDPEQQLRITHEVKAKVESMIPKRPIKPNRSEPDPDASPMARQPNYAEPDPDASLEPNSSEPIPELQKLLFLKSDHPQGIISAGRGELREQEEFVETEYYKQLESIDKEHHKGSTMVQSQWTYLTGTGFIKAAKEGTENGVNYGLPKVYEMKSGGFNGYKSNPATNDWTPSINQVEHVSTKPSRSG